MERLPTTPHDAVFRQMLTQKEVARDFLQIHLPEAFLNICNMETLTLESGSFIEDDLRTSYSDILYSLQTTHGPGYVYALIEHQSKPDKFMAFRLMRYAVAAMQHHLFGEPQLAKALYGNEFALVDLTVMPDNQILQHQRVAMLELLQKHIRRRDLSELLDQLITLLTQDHLTEFQIDVLINYMLKAGNTTEPGVFVRQLAQSAPQYKEQLMTIAEWLEEKGRAEGMQQGLEKGLEEGRQAKARDIAQKMLTSGLEPDLITHLTGLTQEELTALTH